MAREIHDELGQILTIIRIDLAWLSKRLLDKQDIQLKKIESIDELVCQTIEKVKRISAELRPGLLDDLGLAPALEWKAGEFEKTTEIKCEFISNPRDVVLDREQATAIFRIFQGHLLTLFAMSCNKGQSEA